MRAGIIITLSCCCCIGCDTRPAVSWFEDAAHSSTVDGGSREQPADAAAEDGSFDAATLADSSLDTVQFPDAPLGCVHPKVKPQCSKGWCAIPPGCFQMGSPTSEPCREPQNSAAYGKETLHEVVLTRAFQISRIEVTKGEMEVVLGLTDSSVCSGCPVVHVSWHVAAAYCNALSSKQGLNSCYACSGTKYNRTCSAVPAYKDKAIYDCPG